MISHITFTYELVRLIIFGIVLLILAGMELVIPQRPLSVAKGYRWTNNLLMVTFNNILIKLFFPLSLGGIAIWCNIHHIGLFNYFALSSIIVIIISLLILDLIIYIQHRLFHYIQIFWRLHQVHHADLDVDVTTAIRFHSIEIILSFIIKILTIALFGMPVMAVLIFEILLNTTAMFSHSNIQLPQKLDSFMRYLIVTPNMHKIHHSIEIPEANSNFGFNLSWWDKLFNTYTLRPKLAYDKMHLGLKYSRNEQQTQSWLAMLSMPWKK